MLNNLLLSASFTYWPIIVTIITVSLLLYSRYGYGLNSFPGPSLASFTDAWRVWNTWYHKHEKPLVRLHEKYGDVVRIGPRVLSFSSPDAVKEIYGTQQNYKKVRDPPVSLI